MILSKEASVEAKPTQAFLLNRTNTSVIWMTEDGMLCIIVS